jgi:ligand-binding sensor domain-containing protein/signal transduction histidine kinase
MLTLGVNPCLSQNVLRFEHFTSENGLSENFVYAVYQDKNGFLWIGTHDGLNRYDGYGFKKFRHDPADINSLPDNTIYSICEDGQGNIWMGTGAGLSKYDPSTGLFSTLTLNKKLRSVEQVTPVNEEEFILRHERRLCLVNIRTQKEIPLNYRDSSDFYPVSYSRYPVSKDSQGNIYIIKPSDGDAEIFKYDQLNKCFTKFCTLSVPEKLAGLNGGFFYIDSRNHCWLPLGEKDLQVYDLYRAPIKRSQPLKPFDIFSTNAINHIFEDNEGNTWIASNSGLIYHDRASDKANWCRSDNKETSSISSDDVQHIFQDRTGIIWIATANGLNKLNPFQKKIRHLTMGQNNKEGLYNNFVLGLFRDGNEQLRIYYNIYEKRHFTRYHIPTQRFKHIVYTGNDTASWIKEMIVQNPERPTNKIPQLLTDLFEKRNSVSLMENAEEAMWIDSQQLPWYSSMPFTPLDNWLRDVLIEYVQLSGNNLWMASQKGLIQFNILTKTGIVYNAGIPGSNRISSDDITCFVFEDDGNMWIGTKGGGLNFFDREKNSFLRFTEKEGLCNNSIYCMVKDDNGRLWIGTSFGLSNFDPATKKFKNYFRADGLVNNEFNRRSACKMPDGTIFMGGMDGIDFFHPDSLFRMGVNPQIVITDFKLFNKSILLQKNYTLKHDEHFISIEFAAMDFTNPAANKFAYKLEGADKDWVYPEGRNFTTYSYLKPGDYKFLVKAANSEGIWNDEPVICSFTIMPAWYQTWWFLSLSVLSAAGLVYILFRYRLQQKLQIYRIRNRIHRDLHDDVGATLSSVKAYSEILSDNPNNPVIAELIKDNSTEMLERLEVIVWATNPQHDHFKSLKNLMIKFAAPLCHSKNIQFYFESIGINEEMLVAGEIRQTIFLVFKEAINNTIKYADATACNTNIYIRNIQFHMQITDNGKGFDGTTKGSGNGWKNMQKRTDSLDGKLTIESGPGNGTVISMSLPYPFKIPSSWDR